MSASPVSQQPSRLPVQSRQSRETPRPTVERLEELEAQAERLLDQVMQLSERLHAAEEDSAQLRVKLHNATTRETQLTDALDRALAHQKSLHEQLAALRDSARHAPETSTLLARQSETDELMELALAENSDLRQQIATLLQRSDQGDGRILTLEATAIELQERLEEISEQERERHQAAAASLAPRVGVYGFLDAARHLLGLRLCLTVSRSW
jgi:chromosome segregation ATPase